MQRCWPRPATQLNHLGGLSRHESLAMSSAQANGHGPQLVPPQPIGRRPAAADSGRKAESASAGLHGNGLGYGRSLYESPIRPMGSPRMHLPPEHLQVSPVPPILFGVVG